MFTRLIDPLEMDFRPNPRHSRELAAAIHSQFARISEQLHELGADLAEDLCFQADEMERAMRLLNERHNSGGFEEIAELRRRLSRVEARLPGPREL